MYRIRYHFAKYVLLSLSGVKMMKAEPFLDSETGRAAKTETSVRPKEKNHTPFSTLLTFEPNDPRLRSSECLKNAAGLAVDSTSAVLSQTVYAVINIEGRYTELVNRLVLLMEQHLQVLGHGAEEEKVLDLILETRHEINDVYKCKQELAFLLASVKKLVDAAAEVAFATGASYASTSIGERLHSALCEIQQVQTASDEAEKKMRLTEIKSIEVISKHKQKKEKWQERTE